MFLYLQLAWRIHLFSFSQALRDSHVLDLETRQWHQVDRELFSSGRAGHAAALFPDCAVVVGGGDNEGRFFNACENFSLTL